MELRNRIGSALKEAMKAKDAARLSTLRLINAAIKDREIALRVDGEETELSEGEVQAILAKMVKQRQESAKTYEEGGRLDLAQAEEAEIAIIEEFLPRQLDEEETSAAIDAAIVESAATSIRDMGKVMGLLKEKYMGQMDFGLAGPAVKARLSA
ncbi:GatB/YqeY domain-containing protein [Donghicola sp. C2-DW-16]|uniref:GatB/YqeY domain-containing protein n=1 Tax=Donghicola mangrovi TaxID=2729614 RepID=A0A850Q6M2_9RHOB|nr:GatB/YqeY domain-containing protein [Donghicola mangrovi]NVO23812.1 GatB/YqeY domain-containing protein [Donghicola mangrovi]NVO27346.1 GatB/YqeY domain-containing protein [Donghicola mangrovi]